MLQFNMKASRINIGTKLLNELMVDIIGALISGFLFTVAVFASVLFPCLICFKSASIAKLASLRTAVFGGFYLSSV